MRIWLNKQHTVEVWCENGEVINTLLKYDVNMTKITMHYKVWSKNDITRNKSTIKLITYSAK